MELRYFEKVYARDEFVFEARVYFKIPIVDIVTVHVYEFLDEMTLKRFLDLMDYIESASRDIAKWIRTPNDNDFQRSYEKTARSHPYYGEFFTSETIDGDSYDTFPSFWDSEAERYAMTRPCTVGSYIDLYMFDREDGKVYSIGLSARMNKRRDNNEVDEIPF
jgi:hypothetical protein